MSEEELNRFLNKLKEDIRNIKYQINSVNNDIQKNKKQSNIEKRIDRLIQKYRNICEKYKLISDLRKSEIIEIENNLNDVTEKIESVCKIGSEDIVKQNIKLNDGIKKETKYNTYINCNNVVDVYGKDGQLDFVYVTRSDNRKIKAKKTNKKENKITKFLKKITSGGKLILENIGQRKVLRRIAALGMGVLMIIPSTITANEHSAKKEEESRRISYTDNINETPVSKHQFVKVVDEIKENNSPEIKEKQEEKETAQIEKIHIIAPVQCKYTEVSDGSGKYGIFNEETEVSIYNRALIRTNKDGSKSILKATKVGQTWEEYAKEQGINYDEFKEYIENNENIQEVISTMSVDGKNIYGWIPASNLEYRTEGKSKEVQRSYVIEVEER